MPRGVDGGRRAAAALGRPAGSGWGWLQVGAVVSAPPAGHLAAFYLVWSAPAKRHGPSQALVPWSRTPVVSVETGVTGGARGGWVLRGSPPPWV